MISKENQLKCTGLQTWCQTAVRSKCTAKLIKHTAPALKTKIKVKKKKLTKQRRAQKTNHSYSKDWHFNIALPGWVLAGGKATNIDHIHTPLVRRVAVRYLQTHPLFIKYIPWLDPKISSKFLVYGREKLPWLLLEMWNHDGFMSCSK